VRLTRDKKRLIFSLNLIEGTLLRRVFEQLRAQYRLKPDDIDPKTAAAWYSTRGCQSAGMSTEDTRLWIEHLHEFKAARLEKLEAWTRQLVAPRQPGALRLTIPLEDADAFMAALNDHRLRLAACHEIGQKEMDAHSPQTLDRLPIHQQEALLEIHVLAWLIEETLHSLPEPG
jgi:hypothetical protein